MMSECCKSLSIWRFGLAVGLTWGLGMLMMGLINVYSGWGGPMVELLGSVYLGYSATLYGSVVGALWGLADGFVGGALIALFYNLLGCCACCNVCKKD